jgi:glycosyltransferase involved in cell wall biosynthesis
MQAITIIVACYNRAATLERALGSCIAQREAEKIIVVDDGSTDATSSIARVMALRDQRVRLVQMHGNGGTARARNWGALQATTPLVAFLDPDDEYLPGALAAAQAHLAQAPREMRRCGSTWTIAAFPPSLPGIAISRRSRPCSATPCRAAS